MITVIASAKKMALFNCAVAMYNTWCGVAAIKLKTI
jgi:hypothetical protein